MLLQPIHEDVVPPAHITESAKYFKLLLAVAAAHIMLPQRHGAPDAVPPIETASDVTLPPQRPT